MKGTRWDLIKLAGCFIAIVFSSYIYYHFYGDIRLSAFFKEDMAYLFRHIILFVIGAYLGILSTITLKNDLKKYQSGTLILASGVLLGVYLYDIFTHLRSQFLYYLISTFSGFLLGFLYSWKVHPTNGVCIFSEIPYKRQQRIITLAAIVPLIYIVLVFIFVILGRNHDLNSISLLFIGLILGAIGVYEFIKIDVGSTNIAILGDSSSGKSVLIAALYGFMCDSKFQSRYRGPVSRLSNKLAEFLNAERLEEENPQHRYYADLRAGRSWGKPTPIGNVIFFGTKVKILPEFYKCLSIVLPDYPGELTSFIVELLRDEKIRKSIPKVKDIESDESIGLVKILADNLAEKRKLSEETAKTIALILTLIKNSDKVFYLIDAEEFIVELIERGYLHVNDSNIKNYFLKLAKKYRDVGRKINFTKKVLEYFNLRDEIYSIFGKELKLVLTKVDLIATLSNYTNLEGFRRFAEYFVGVNDENRARNYVLGEILTRIVGPHINTINKDFAITGVISRVEPNSGDLRILPRGGESADEFIRIRTFIDLFGE